MELSSKITKNFIVKKYCLFVSVGKMEKFFEDPSDFFFYYDKRWNLNYTTLKIKYNLTQQFVRTLLHKKNVFYKKCTHTQVCQFCD